MIYKAYIYTKQSNSSDLDEQILFIYANDRKDAKDVALCGINPNNLAALILTEGK
jgi:hypothetical protein